MSLQFGNVRNLRPGGGYALGSLKLQADKIIFTSASGKISTINKNIIKEIKWIQANRRCQLRVWYKETDDKLIKKSDKKIKEDTIMRINGLRASEYSTCKEFFQKYR